MTFQEVENARNEFNQAEKKLIAPVVIGFVLMMLASLAAAGFTGGALSGFVLLFISFVIAIDGFFLNKAIKKKREKADLYKKLYKAYFVEQGLKKVFTDINYNHDQGMPEEEIRATGMIKMGDTYRSNDLFTAKYHEVSLRQADVNILQSYTDPEGNTQYKTIFDGRWMTYEFPKKFNFNLQVVQRGFKAEAKPSKNKTTGRKIKKITTESPDFNDQFVIYAEDDFETYYILDPAFMTRIMEVSAQEKGKIMLCFTDNKLHVAVYDEKDAFEPPKPSQPLDEATESAKVSQDIKAITDYVDYLKLDRKLFKTNS